MVHENDLAARAQIRRVDGGGLQLTCLGSNQVHVDGRALKAGDAPVALAHGDRLKLGKTVLLLQAPDAVPTVATEVAIGGQCHYHAPLYISLVILLTKRIQGRGNDVAARG